LTLTRATPKLATAVLASFRQTVKEGQLFAHPIGRDMLAPGLLKAGAGETGKAEAGRQA
jgi:hypothetical protein